MNKTWRNCEGIEQTVNKMWRKWEQTRNKQPKFISTKSQVSVFPLCFEDGMKEMEEGHTKFALAEFTANPKIDPKNPILFLSLKVATQ